MSKTSPTQRSLAFLRKEGYLCNITEHYNPFSHTRQDLFNFIDVLAIKENEILAVQTTSAVNSSARVKKILALLSAKAWLESGGKIIVHGWSKKGAKDKRKLWAVNVVEVTLEHFIA
jgi:hypothetical protein